MTKEQKFYCKIGQAVCDVGRFILLLSIPTSGWIIASLLANLI